MKIKNFLTSILLVLSISSAAFAQVAPPVIPGMPPLQQQQAAPGPQPQPATPADPTAQPGTPIEEPTGFPQFFRFFFEHSQAPTAATPQQLEQRYHKVWEMIGDTYRDPALLQDWSQWEHKYDGKLQTQGDLDKALKELTDSLNDQWTKYVSGAEIAAMRSTAQAGIVRAGASLKQESNGSYTVDFLVWNSPAQRSDLRKGDTIKSVDGKDLNGLSQADAEKLLSGKAGDKLTVVYSHSGRDHTLTITLAPTIDFGVEAKLLPGNIGYVRLPSFRDEMVIGEFLQAVADLNDATGGKLQGLVLDLRGNPGGQFQLAIMLSSMFLEKGTIVTGTTRSGRMVQHNTWEVIPLLPHQLKNAPDDILALTTLMQTLPLSVITDGSSASSSEVLTGALKDNGRATIVGETTYGKGVGYNSYTLPGGGRLTITTLDYLTPSGYNLSNRGIAPNVEVAQPRGSAVDEQLNAAYREVRDQILNPAKRPTSALRGSLPDGLSPTGLLVCLFGAALVALIVLAIARRTQ